VDGSERESSDKRSADGEVEALPLESFITATTVALAEMARTEVAVREVYRATPDDAWGGVSAVLELKSATEGLLVLSFPEPVAAAVAKRVLVDVKEELNESLVRDCVGEIANVIAGQAKTLLAGTPYQMNFSLPEVVAGGRSPSHPERGLGGVVIAFESDLGEFTLRLVLNGQQLRSTTGYGMDA
jgi:chemotaxis protein CheX